MRGLLERISRYRYKIALACLLVAASVISLVLERFHTHLNGIERYAFLPFNLKLAWIPFLAAVAANASTRNRVLFILAMPVCSLIWLIFFPNAPYLLTDFQHLATSRTVSPLWFDVVVMVWFAWTGLLLGITSLYLMQEIVTHKLNSLAGWVFALGMTILSGLGVYLGRFLRWNSWDLLKDPLPIARDVVGIVRDPFTNLGSIGFTLLFTLLFLFIYLTVHLFGRMIAIKN
jgi:uncharacterized membrane protein